MSNEHEHERALLFMNRKILVHASTDKFWSNGFILEVSDNFFVIKDRLDNKEHFIFFSELNSELEPFKDKEEIIE